MKFEGASMEGMGLKINMSDYHYMDPTFFFFSRDAVCMKFWTQAKGGGPLDLNLTMGPTSIELKS